MNCMKYDVEKGIYPMLKLTNGRQRDLLCYWFGGGTKGLLSTKKYELKDKLQAYHENING